MMAVGGSLRVLFLAVVTLGCTSWSMAYDSVLVMPRVDTTDPMVKRVVAALQDTIQRWRLPPEAAEDPDRRGAPGNVAGIIRNWCSPTPTVVKHFPATIMSVERGGETDYVARVIISSTDDAGSAIPFGIIRTAFDVRDSVPVARVPLDEATAEWETQRVGRITYVFPPEIDFRKRRAERANAFLLRTAAALGVEPPDGVRYVITRDRDELCSVLGVEYLAVPPSAITYPFQRTVIVGAHEEAYLHELVHIVLADHPAGNEVIREGIATLYGGSLGVDVTDLVTAYARETPPLDVPTLTQLFTEGERLQNDVYMGAVICDAIRRRHGVGTLIDLLHTSSTALTLQRCAELLTMEPSDTMVTLTDLLDETVQSLRSEQPAR